MDMYSLIICNYHARRKWSRMGSLPVLRNTHVVSRKVSITVFHSFPKIAYLADRTQEKYFLAITTQTIPANLWVSYNSFALQWRHNGRDDVLNHRRLPVCLLNRVFWSRSKNTLKLHVTGLCAGNSPMTGEFPAQRASNAENVSIWWRHHGFRSNTHHPYHSYKIHSE